MITDVELIRLGEHEHTETAAWELSGWAGNERLSVGTLADGRAYRCQVMPSHELTEVFDSLELAEQDAAEVRAGVGGYGSEWTEVQPSGPGSE